ncbi:hypothetical protein WJX72_001443 [[Myrmecia] bisecta]|uniref:Gamma-secretase subunit PEN-2 n=1 Tax=[Myrmecia] bisecta TaxID=41462 RepID=A0AAW1QE77_9CHLO
MWFVNVWFFWADFRSGRDPVLRKYTRRSAVGFLLVSAIFLPWMLTFMIGQAAVVGDAVFNRWNAAGLDLSALGLVT